MSQQQNSNPALPACLTCPICGAAAHAVDIGHRAGWVCSLGGYSHYYQVRYGHLKRWFTSGEGNLREPVIRAMNCAA